MTMKNDTRTEEELTCRFKIDVNFTKFDPSTQKVNFFNWLLVIEVYFVWATKVQRSYFHDTEELCKFWRKTDQCFDKRNEKFGKFSPELLKVSKLELWWGPFVQSRKGMTLKFTEELCVMTMKNNAKFEEELTFHFKTDMRNLTNFDSSTRKSKKIAL